MTDAIWICDGHCGHYTKDEPGKKFVCPTDHPDPARVRSAIKYVPASTLQAAESRIEELKGLLTEAEKEINHHDADCPAMLLYPDTCECGTGELLSRIDDALRLEGKDV